ncbi:MAG: NAD-dependent epimerase/dehydratase family protein [Pseudomonadota bacterium]
MYLITGGAGFIGCHTVRLLLERGVAVRVLDDLSSGSRANLAGLEVELLIGSINDPEALGAAVAGCSHVIHLAAIPGVSSSIDDPVRSDHANVNGTVAVFAAARAAGVRRVVYASSCAVYGQTGGQPVHEDDRLQPASPYAATKAADELYGGVFSATLGLPCVGLRYQNVFGPRQDPHGPYAAVIPRFVELRLRGLPLPIQGDGEQSRDFVAVADVARANLLAATAPDARGVYNIGTGRSTTVNQIAALVQRCVPGVAGVEHQPPRQGDIRHMVADCARAARELGWRAEADFEAAMAETIGWYAERAPALSRAAPG